MLVYATVWLSLIISLLPAVIWERKWIEALCCDVGLVQHEA